MLLLKYLFLSVLRVAYKAFILLLLVVSGLLVIVLFDQLPWLPGEQWVWVIVLTLLLACAFYLLQQRLTAYFLRERRKAFHRPDEFFQLREGTTHDFIVRAGLIPQPIGQGGDMFLVLPVIGMLALIALPVSFFLTGTYAIQEKVMTALTIPFFIQIGITTSYLFDLHEAHKI